MTDQGIRDKELSELYKRSRHQTSPPALDSRILAEADAALGNRSGGWMRPLALAATVVLGVGVALRIGDEAAVPMLQSTEPAYESDLTRPDKTADEAHAVPESSATPPGTLADTDQLQKREERVAMPKPQPEIEPERVAPGSAAGLDEAKKKTTDSRAPRIEDLTRKAAEQARQRNSTDYFKKPARSVAVPSGTAPASVSAYAGAEVDADSALRQQLDSSAQAPCFHEMANPDLWLDCIKSLREAGDIESAEQSMERFQNAYPEHPAAKTR